MMEHAIGESFRELAPWFYVLGLIPGGIVIFLLLRQALFGPEKGYCMSESFRIEPITNGYLVHRMKINIANQGMHETIAVTTRPTESTADLVALLKAWLDFRPPREP